MQSPLLLDSCLPRLRSRRLGGSRAGHWTRSSLLRKMQHVKCILRVTSDGWQACLHGIRSRRRAVTDQRWTLCLLLLTPSEHEMEMKNHQTVHVYTPNCYSTISILRSFRMLISANEFSESVTVVCIHYSCDQCTDRIGTSEGEVCAGCARCCAHGEVV